MDTQEFSEEEWRSVLDEFRLLVVRAGYAAWDAAMIESLAEDDESSERLRIDREPTRPAVEDLRRYAGAFMRYLKSRSSYAYEERRGQLADLLHTADGAPVSRIVLNIEGEERPIFADSDGSDAMIEELGRFLGALDGEDGGFWENGTDDTEDGA